jgi:imidazoleglycerol phosphate dehydratase HisB
MSDMRTASVSRKTTETDVTVKLTLDLAPGVAQEITVKTGIGFLDHACVFVFMLSKSSYDVLTDVTYRCCMRLLSMAE